MGEDVALYIKLLVHAVGLVGSYLVGLVVYSTQSYSVSKIEEMAEAANEELKKRIKKLDARWQEIYDTAILLRLLFNLVVFIPVFMYKIEMGDIPKTLVQFGILFALIVLLTIVGYVIPRAVSRLGEESIFLRYAPSVNLVSYLLYPFTATAKRTEGLVGRIAGVKESTTSEALTEEEILDIVSDGEAQGVIEETELAMIQKIFKFEDLPVSEVMTKRGELTMIAADAPLEDAARLAVELGHSRIPVFENDRDNVVGILYVKDLLKHWNDLESRGNAVRSLMRTPFFVPETKHIGDLFTDFKAKHIHFAVVLDEYGGTAGVITVEDIVEEIVGEIVDEYDFDETHPELKKQTDGVYIFDAKMELNKFAAELQLEFPDVDGISTVGGLVLEALGHIPIPGETVLVGTCEFTVLDADARAIKKLSMKIAKQDKVSEPDGD